MQSSPPAAPSRAAAARRRSLAFYSGAVALAFACAATPPEAWLDRARPPAEADATAGFYAPDEVDAVARLVTPIAPRYPPHLRERGREGHVVARVLVREDGSVAGAELLDVTDPLFAVAARSELRGSRFAPALLGGRPVPSWVVVRIRFRIT